MGFRKIDALAISKATEKARSEIRDAIAPRVYHSEVIAIPAGSAGIEPVLELREIALDCEYPAVGMRAREQSRSGIARRLDALAERITREGVRFSADVTVAKDTLRKTSSAFPTVAVVAELIAALHAEVGADRAGEIVAAVTRTCRPMADNGTGVSDTGPSPAFVGIDDARKAACSDFRPLRKLAAQVVSLWVGVTSESVRETRGSVSVKGGFSPFPAARHWSALKR